MPRVVIVGGLSPLTLFWSIKRGFERAGCDTFYWPSIELGLDANHKPERRPWRDIQIQLNYALEQPVDLLLWIQPQNGCPLDFLADWKKRAGRATLAMLSFDDPYMIDFLKPQGFGVFDLGVTCCEGSFDWYRSQGMRPVLGYPPVDPDLFGRAEHDPQFAHDIAMVGTNTYPQVVFPKTTADRVDMIRVLADLGDVAVYGWWGKLVHDWQRLGEPLKKYYRGWLAYPDHPKLFCSTKINLASHVRPDGYKYLNERVLLVMGAGGFLLCDRVNGITELFDEGKEIALWGTLEELRAKTEYYLSHDAERRAIARAGQEKVLRLYNTESLARSILAEAAK